MNTQQVQQLLKMNEVSYVKILSDCFLIKGITYGELFIGSFELLYLRKYWENGNLFCFSKDCSYGKNNQLCAQCKLFKPHDLYRSPCKLRLRLTWYYKGKKFCMELPSTGIKNFINAQNLLDSKQFQSTAVGLKLYVSSKYNRNSGEVRFEPWVNP